ncbi:unnamed protein product [Triticum turgidum subsp. durum]|uniref:RNase H type-1 domain-containing protein n=1 Tax=Triticum turgidum subsp. durum TaxID=4567 RepID=A0A9R0V345_TRITD|nr:unnamed protein product [Triticum turgidum subsp. durum]
MMWQAWNLRNNVVHGDGKDTVTGSVQYLTRLQDELLVTACGLREHSDNGKVSLHPANPEATAPIPPSHWIAPPLGMAKVNSDAAFIGETGDTWGGAVARDHLGRVFMSIGRRLNRCSSVEEAEGAAALLGLTEFAKRFRGQVILETDCMCFGRELQGGMQSRSAYCATLADVKEKLSLFSCSGISIVSRSKNKLAHELAAVARRSGDFIMVADVPVDAKHVMRDESVLTMA